MAYGRSMTVGELELALIASNKSSRLELPADDPGTHSDPAADVNTVPLEAQSLEIRSNVVSATEGRTIRGETLGHGDASQILQHFWLAEPPAYLRPGSGSSEPRSTIEVRVQGQPWREVRRLYGEGPDHRVFEVQPDHQGRAAVIFGDGVHGACLPTGHANVVADYRTGTSDRDILAGSVRLMTSRPLGLASVGNPLTGIPGAPAEDPRSSRQRAPRSVLTLGRIVSLRDYADFAESFPGIAKASARRLALAGRQIVHLTVASQDRDHPPASGSRQLEELLHAIEAIRCAQESVHIVPFKPVELKISAKVRITPWAVWKDIEPRLHAALEQRFSFAESRFGASSNAAEVIRVLQSIEEVAAVDLDTFCRADALRAADEPKAAAAEESTIKKRQVTAELASWDNELSALRPAELVWLKRAELKKFEKPPDGAESS